MKQNWKQQRVAVREFLAPEWSVRLQRVSPAARVEVGPTALDLRTLLRDELPGEADWQALRKGGVRWSCSRRLRRSLAVWKGVL